jgi:putative hydrolase of the HAD superfamily
MLIPKHIRCVLFDAVGTLIYPDPPVTRVYVDEARRFGSALTDDEIAARFRAALSRHSSGGGPTSETNEQARWSRIVADTLSDLSADHSEQIFERLWNHFGRSEHWRLYEDVEPTLAALRGRGFELGIASNFDRRLLNIVSGNSVLAACVYVFMSSEVGYSKPSLDFFRSLERRLGLRADELALVGDDEINDVQGAAEAGWMAIRLDRRATHQSRDAIGTLGKLL